MGRVIREQKGEDSERFIAYLPAGVFRQEVLDMINQYITGETPVCPCIALEYYTGGQMSLPPKAFILGTAVDDRILSREMT
jgi:hypothetical protein